MSLLHASSVKPSAVSKGHWLSALAATALTIIKGVRGPPTLTLVFCFSSPFSSFGYGRNKAEWEAHSAIVRVIY